MPKEIIYTSYEHSNSVNQNDRKLNVFDRMSHNRTIVLKDIRDNGCQYSDRNGNVRIILFFIMYISTT